MDKKKIFIGELSKQTEVPTKTIRYYEDFGLLEKPKRTNSEYRIYVQEDVEKLLFIKKGPESRDTKRAENSHQSRKH